VLAADVGVEVPALLQNRVSKGFSDGGVPRFASAAGVGPGQAEPRRWSRHLKEAEGGNCASPSQERGESRVAFQIQQRQRQFCSISWSLGCRMPGFGRRWSRSSGPRERLGDGMWAPIVQSRLGHFQKRGEMTPRLVTFRSESCSDCRACELECSFVHFRLFNRNKSAIRITPDWPQPTHAAVCRQCDVAGCLEACPTGALHRTGSGPLQFRADDCVQCGACVEACPYDSIWLDASSGRVVGCDTCDGRYRCTQVCVTGALTLVDVEE
jgi:anaerobic carbon-monoxide dehydrogenase iron sulfur subunit